MDTLFSKITIGILAHVDAGKTTLSEALLVKTGAIRKAGRVDHRDSFLDNHGLERKRGITIFSKPALFSTQSHGFTLLDTPGHGDFSPEAERVLDILDYAILVVSAPDGVTGRVRQLWRLLEHYRVPVFVFVNKMDQPGSDPEALMRLLGSGLGEGFFEGRALLEELSEEQNQESLALLEEGLLSGYLNGRAVSLREVRELVKKRLLFPVFFGSALKMTGLELLLRGLEELTLAPQYPDTLGGRIYKISYDGSTRLTWIKLTGGRLSIRDEIGGEKVDGIRKYSGSGFEALREGLPGDVLALQGLYSTRPGQRLGQEEPAPESLLRPVEQARVILPPSQDPFEAYEKLKLLEEEEPLLSLSYQDGRITLGIMGEVQEDILKALALERYGLELSFGPPEIIYRETILEEIEGVGHFEPLRHYAEVHLLLVPGERGSGLVFGSLCSKDVLPEHFQRLILSQLKETLPPGVLTGSPLTDMKILLLSGRYHEKHTEGGDFREAAGRALRQGLMGARNRLLEPFMSFRISLPREYIGRAMSDLSMMNAVTDPPVEEELSVTLTGLLPAARIGDYPRQLTSYTSGKGSISLIFSGYAPCLNEEEVLAEKAYDPDRDPAYPSGSVFCSHGRGELIPWQEVRKWMHVDSGWRPPREENEKPSPAASPAACSSSSSPSAPLSRKEEERRKRLAEQELEDIFLKVHGPIRERPMPSSVFTAARQDPEEGPVELRLPELSSYLLVDGYNMIFAWEELQELAKIDIGSARDRLMDILVNFAGMVSENVILVFDAYKVSGGQERVFRYHNIDVVYTKEAETADQYIEKTAHKLSRKNRVYVATSDSIEQVIVFGAGAIRLSASNLLERIREEERRLKDYTKGFV